MTLRVVPVSLLLVVPVVVLLCARFVVVVSARDCADLDIRNDVKNLEVLRNCTVINGHLQIVLMDGSRNNFTGYSFPQLREITGFLMLYRVLGLADLGQLFPNLVIIRGATRFADYALIIYDIPDLATVGLKNLLAIDRGFVRIELCPKLCYASTIDWSLITRTAKGNMISQPGIGCPDASKLCKFCPMEGKCWSHVNCQKKIGDKITKLIHGGNCHPNCLGKCTDKTASGCLVCKHVSDNGTCVETCPPSTIINHHMNRCVTDDQCRLSNRVIHGGECLRECPPEFMINKSDRTCSPCNGRCPKFCSSQMIEYMSFAEDLLGCNIVQGDLLIKVSSDMQNVEQELEYHLGHIEEIEGYLKIYRSTSITSLNFLRSLKVIHGHKLDSNKYAFVLFDNQNLKRVFDFSTRQPLEIRNGSMSIHYNYKLCQSEIEQFRKHTNIADHPGNNLPHTNAASNHCDFKPIDSDYLVLSSHEATVFWRPYHTSEPNQTVDGYTLYYMETTRDNLNWFNGRETCSKYSWKVKSIDVGDEDDDDLGYDKEKDMYYHQLRNLKQVTKYAFYVRSYQSVVNSISGQSVVRYFTTPLEVLTPPVVTTLAKGENSITLNWRVPIKERPLISFYHVDVMRLPDEKRVLDARDYCTHPVENDPVMEARVRELELRDEIEECNCDENLNEDEFVSMQHELYDRLRRLYYGDSTIDCQDSASHAICETYENKRFKRSLHDFQRRFVLPQNHTIDKREITMAANYFNSFRIGTEWDNYTIEGLEPYSNYAFEFFACVNDTECSAFSFHADRTYPVIDNDQMENVTVITDGHQTITLQFTQPKQPNGATLGYKVEQRLEMELGTPSIISCVTRLEHERRNNSFVISNLTPNSYAFRVKSFSLALESEWTEWKVVELKEDTSPHSLNMIVSLIAIFIVSMLVSCGIYSYRSFNCLRKGDDAIYLMSQVERDVEEDDHLYGDFFPVDFSRTDDSTNSQSQSIELTNCSSGADGSFAGSGGDE